MNKKIFLTLSFFAALIVIPSIALAANGSFTYVPMEKIPGFVTTGNFYSYIGTVYKFGLWVVGICALFMIGIGGYMYLISAGNSASMSNAKSVIFDALAGLILALLSFLILYEINPNLVRLDGGSAGGGASTTRQSTPGPATPTSGDEAVNRARLQAAEININHANACPPGQGSGCTSTAGLREKTLSGVESLKKACPNCNITLTGGSEGGHASRTIYTHANGYKADLALDSNLNNYIKSNYTPIGNRAGDGAPQYKDSAGNIYAQEGDHWDVCYACVI